MSQQQLNDVQRFHLSLSYERARTAAQNLLDADAIHRKSLRDAEVAHREALDVTALNVSEPDETADELHYALTHYRALQENIHHTIKSLHNAWCIYHKTLKRFHAIIERIAQEVGANPPQFERTPWLTTQLTQLTNGVKYDAHGRPTPSGIVRVAQLRESTQTAEDVFAALTK